jgi:branched-chain amino acid transport system substrate-binding protein
MLLAVVLGTLASITPAAAKPGADAKAANPHLPPLEIGLINVTRGVQTYPGATAGATTAAKYVNAQLGGVDGHPIKIVACGAGPDAESEQACGQRFANDATVKVVTTGVLFAPGGMYSSLSPTGKPIVGAAPLTAADFGASDTYFYTSGSPGIAAGIVQWTVDNLAPKTVALVVSDDDAGRAVPALIEPRLRAAGVDVKIVRVANDEPDATGPITAAGARDADVFMPLLPAQSCIQVAKTLKQLAIDTKVVSASPCTDSSVLKAAAADMDGWYYGFNGPFILEPKGTNADVDTFNKVWKKYGTGPRTASGVPLTFANVLTIAKLATAIPWDQISSETLTTAIAGFTGPMFLGPPEVKCPGQPFPPLCSTQMTMIRYKGGVWHPVDHGAWIDAFSTS